MGEGGVAAAAAGDGVGGGVRGARPAVGRSRLEMLVVAGDGGGVKGTYVCGVIVCVCIWRYRCRDIYLLLLSRYTLVIIMIHSFFSRVLLVYIPTHPHPPIHTHTPIYTHTYTQAMMPHHHQKPPPPPPPTTTTPPPHTHIPPCAPSTLPYTSAVVMMPHIGRPSCPRNHITFGMLWKILHQACHGVGHAFR